MKKCILLILSAILIWAGCQGTQSGKDPDTLYGHMSSNPTTLNAVSMLDAYASDYVHQRISDPLLDVDKDLNIIPCVAKSWEWKKQGKHLILEFKLRDDVYWHDGVKMTAHDWVFTYSAITNVKSKAFNKSVKFKGLVDWVKASDDYTLHVAYNRPFAPALMSWVDLFAIPKHLYEGLSWEEFHSSSYNRTPVGNGGYRMSKWETGKVIELVVNTNYWREQPKMKRIQWKIINDDNVALIAFRNGDFDIHAFTPEQFLLEAKQEYLSNEYHILTYSRFGTSQIAWNCLSNSLFSDKLVRQAMTHALDRKGLAKEIFHDFSEVVTGVNKKGFWAYDSSIPAKEFNLEKSKALLAQAGWKDTDEDGILDKDGRPFQFEVVTGTGSPDSEAILLNLKENLFKIGVNMELRPLEWGAMHNRLVNKDFDALMFGWSLDFDPDMYDIFHSDSIEDGLNYGSYSNAALDKLIEKDRSTMNQAQRQVLQHKIHRLLNEEQVYTHLFSRKAIVAVRKDIKGLVVSMDGLWGHYPGISAVYREKPNTNH